MNKIKRLIPLLFCALAICLTSCGSNEKLFESGQNNTLETAKTENASLLLNRFNRNDNTIDFSGLIFTPWDVKDASSRVRKQAIKPYTMMVYMNGSDLESENGAATDDLFEMLESGVNSEIVNIIVFTGGTNRWQNDVIPANDCVVWEIRDGQIHKITGVGLVNMGDPGTLASFIDFSVNNFPAEKYGLIMWDHGGGSIAGYGHDEKFNESNLTLLDLNYAFKRSALSKKKLAFLGFDSCLMATVEMAVIASDYADYLIASEDLEPGEGWDYSFLSVLNTNPKIDGAELGKSIVDHFMGYYGVNSDEILTLSVIDLSQVKPVMGALENLMKRCSNSLLADRRSSFNVLAKKRSGTKTFGEGSPRDNECDMVDIGDMAHQLSDLFPDETANVIKQLENCVVYNKHNSDTNLMGLSVYYIYGGKAFGSESLDTYTSLKINDEHTNYLNNFYGMLKTAHSGRRNRMSNQKNSGDSIGSPDDIIHAKLTLWQPLKGMPGHFIMTGIRDGANDRQGETSAMDTDVPWPTINGENVCLFKINSTKYSSLFAAPSVLNEKDCDIIVLFSDAHPGGKVLGARYEDGFVIQKGFDKLKDGDKLSFYFQAHAFGDNKSLDESHWYKSDAFTVKGELKVEWSKLREDTNYYYSFLLTDILHNGFLTDLEPVPQ